VFVKKGALAKKDWETLVQNKRAENAFAVFSLSDAEICNTRRSYEKRKAYKKKKCNGLSVLAKTPQLNCF